MPHSCQVKYGFINCPLGAVIAKVTISDMYWEVYEKKSAFYLMGNKGRRYLLKLMCPLTSDSGNLQLDHILWQPREEASSWETWQIKMN